MYEDHTIEAKYLHNFSEKEKKSFCREQQRWRKDQAKYRANLEELLSSDSPAVFSNWEPRPSTALEIKYMLNRIAENDPRDTKFELGSIDPVSNPGQLALQIAKSFQTNSVCKTVVLSEIGLTDNAILPILSVLSRKELELLDISGNKITNKTIRVIEKIVKDPNTKWKHIQVGKLGTIKSFILSHSTMCK